MEMDLEEFGPWMSKLAADEGKTALAARLKITRRTLDKIIDRGWAQKRVMKILGVRLAVRLGNK